MSAAVHVGRLSALAVALDVGAAIAYGTAVAWADASGDSDSSAHETSASASHNRAHRPSSRPSSPSASGTASKSAVRTAPRTATVSPSRVARITAAAASVPKPGVGDSPTTPAATPAVWALAASARREFEPSASTSRAASATTSQPTAAVATSPSTLESTPVGWVTGQANNAWPQTNNTCNATGGTCSPTSLNIWGADVGVMWENGLTKNIQVAFGDTFSGPNQTGFWRSNVLLLSNNIDLVHGLKLPQTGPTYQFIPSAPGALFPILNSEVTVIPSSAVYVKFVDGPFGGYFAGLTGAKTGGNVSEMSVQYNDYLEKYAVLYANGSNNMVLRTADTPEGPWSDPVTIATSLQYPGLYAPMIHPWSGTGKLNSQADGLGTPDFNNLCWNMSIWGNYNVVLMQTDLTPLTVV
jgi:hypothetical protein